MFTFELPVKRATDSLIEIRLIDQQELDLLYSGRSYRSDLIRFDVAGNALYITNALSMGDLFDIVSTHENWYDYDHAIPQSAFNALRSEQLETRGVWCYAVPNDYSGGFVSMDTALEILKNLLLSHIVTGKSIYSDYCAEHKARQEQYKARVVLLQVDKWIAATL